MLKRLIVMVVLLAAVGCGKETSHDTLSGGGQDVPETPEIPEVVQPEEKPVMLWIDAHENFFRFQSKANVRFFLDKIKENGFNQIVLDIKPINSSALYDSDFLPDDHTFGDLKIPYDYTAYMIEQARKRGLKVSLSATILTLGEKSQWKEADGHYWDDKYCLEHLPGGFRDIRQNPKIGYSVFPFLNPVLPEVHDYVMRMVREIVTKYKVDGFVLDYCRYPDIHSDFSAASKAAFEKYSGKSVTDFPADIYGYSASGKIVYGKYFKDWVAWRASVIKGYVRDIRQIIKEVSPDTQLEYWAGSWWQAIYDKGQNWASPDIDAVSLQEGMMPGSTTRWALPDYNRQGFADHLDAFQLGAYLEQVYGPDSPTSVEFAVKRAKAFIGQDCKIYGTFSVTAQDPAFAREASCFCYKNTDGVMVFELSHVINKNKWEDIKAGIDKARQDE